MISPPVYISDLDGTLLQRDAKLSKHSRSSILRLLDKGVLFTVATARSVTSTKEILGEIPFSLPVICSNGGSIYNYNTLEPHHLEYLPRHIVNEVILDIKERGDTAFISVNDGGQEKVFYDGLPNDGMHWYYEDRLAAQDKRLTLVGDIREVSDMPITTITFMNRLFKIDKTRKYFAKNYRNQFLMNFFENKYSLGWHWLSIHSREATKANAIKKMQDLTGLSDNPLVVFGDELNDIPMFEKADKAIAVGNALPSVMEFAHEIIGGHHEDAVVNYILEAHNMA